jgi:hypothetical protein
MGIQESNWHKVPVLDKLFQNRLFGLRITAGVNNNRFTGFIPDQISILVKRIEFKMMDGYHM